MDGTLTHRQTVLPLFPFDRTDRPSTPSPDPVVPIVRRSRTVVCAGPLVDCIEAMAERAETSVSALAVSALMLWRASGCPVAGDEASALSPTEGKLKQKRRVPGLRVKIDPDVSDEDILAALTFVAGTAGYGPFALTTRARLEAADMAERERDSLRQALESLVVMPPEGSVPTPRQAARTLGFASEWGLTREQITKQFRALAPLYHPDTGVAVGDRMMQLIQARDLLLKHA